MSEQDIPQKAVREQYKDSGNLGARINVHDQFSTNPYGWFRFVMDHLLALPDGARILEVGGGPAAIWHSQRQRMPGGWKIVFSDASPGMVQHAHARMAGSGQFLFATVDACAIPFGEASFDGVVANHMLYHVPDLSLALGEIRRVLKPGGVFFAATNGTTHMQELYDLIIQFDREMRDLLGSFQRAFNLENGSEAIGAHFQNVSMAQYPDALSVTQAQPLVDYMLSLASLQNNQRMREPGVVRAFTEAVETQIRQKGAFSIQKETGLFVAR